MVALVLWTFIVFVVRHYLRLHAVAVKLVRVVVVGGRCSVVGTAVCPCVVCVVVVVDVGDAFGGVVELEVVVAVGALSFVCGAVVVVVSRAAVIVRCVGVRVVLLVS